MMDTSTMSQTHAGEHHPAGSHLEHMIVQKEMELREMHHIRVQSLEKQLQDKAHQHTALVEALRKMKQDFQYNLSLIQQRDEELLEYEQTFASLKALVQDRDMQISDLRAREDDLCAELQREVASREETQVEFKSKVKQLQDQSLTTQWNLENRLKTTREALEARVRQLERVVKEKEQEIDTRVQDSMNTFDVLMDNKEAAFNTHTRSLEDQIHDLQALNAKQAHDMERISVRQKRASEEADQFRAKCTTLEDANRKLQWDLEAASTAETTRRKALRHDLAQLKIAKDTVLEDYEARMTEVVEALHGLERDLSVQQVRHETELHSLVAQHKEDELAHRKEFETERLQMQRQLQVEKSERLRLREELNTANLALEAKRSQALECEKWRASQVQHSNVVEDLQRELATKSLVAERQNQQYIDASARIEMQATEIASLKERLMQRESSPSNHQPGDHNGTSVARLENQVAKLETKNSQLVLEVSQLRSENAQMKQRQFVAAPGQPERGSSSPIFDGDLGPASPLLSIHSSSTHSEAFANDTGPTDSQKLILEQAIAKEARLVAENQRLSQAVTDMREEVETLMREQQALELRSKQNEQLNNQLSMLQTQMEFLMKNNNNASPAPTPSVTEEQLADANQEIAALKRERDRLMEYSNNLKAHVKMLQANQAVAGQPLSSAEMKFILNTAEKQAAAKFKNKIQVIEQSLVKLEDENKHLKLLHEGSPHLVLRGPTSPKPQPPPTQELIATGTQFAKPSSDPRRKPGPATTKQPRQPHRRRVRNYNDRDDLD